MLCGVGHLASARNDGQVGQFCSLNDPFTLLGLVNQITLV
jgi:hypothetical protein